MHPLPIKGTRKWDDRYMDMALRISGWSKDPRRKVGCYVVDPITGAELSHGYNGFPREVKDDDRLDNRALKMLMVVHAEANAVANAARLGRRLEGGWAYITKQPCSQCAALLIQVGITRVVYQYVEPRTDQWKESERVALDMLRETSIEVEVY